MRIFKSTRLHLLLLALSLLVISTILSLSAYLTDRQTYYGTFRTATGQELGFNINGKELEEQVVVPGGTVSLNASANVTGTTPLYVFVDIDVPADVEITDMNSGWKRLSEERGVYYYGTDSALASLGPDNPSVPIFDNLALSADVEGGESYMVTVTGYAIQAQSISANDPAAVFGMISSSSADTTGDAGGD